MNRKQKNNKTEDAELEKSKAQKNVARVSSNTRTAPTTARLPNQPETTYLAAKEKRCNQSPKIIPAVVPYAGPQCHRSNSQN